MLPLPVRPVPAEIYVLVDDIAVPVAAVATTVDMIVIARICDYRTIICHFDLFLTRGGYILTSFVH